MQSNPEDKIITLANKITAIRIATQNCVKQSPEIIEFQIKMEMAYRIQAFNIYCDRVCRDISEYAQKRINN